MRTRLLRIALPVVLLLLPAALAFGQAVSPRYVGGFSLGGLFPAGDFNEHVSQDGLGFGLYMGKRIRATPFFCGLDLAIHIYGHNHRHEYIEGIPEVPLDVDTYNNIVQSLFFLRFQPRTGRLVTFVEGLAGLSYMFTDTEINSHGLDNDTISSATNFDDFTWAAGGSAGLSVRLGRWRFNEAGKPRAFYLDLKVRYLAGGRAEYLKKGSIVVVGNEYSFTPERSATSFITAQLGFTWFF